MALPIPRLHLFEINDQSWFPPTLREYVQAVLTFFWKLRAPILQPASPATLVSRTLQRVLGSHLQDYTFVDFCAGAGGPTPSIERQINKHLRQTTQKRGTLRHGQLNGDASTNEQAEEPTAVDFILTDIHPHLPAWKRASERSARMKYVPVPVDAAQAPQDLLQLAGISSPGDPLERPRPDQKLFRLFSLAFHHFDDELAVRILQNTLATSSGFAIFELQGRDLGNLFTVLLLGPFLWVGSWYWFWGNWDHLFWTYCVPLVPFVVVYDGIISCLRTRTEREVMMLINKAAEAEGPRQGNLLDGWRFETGGETHTWPGGKMQYFIGVKD
ncbi:MAG: hypothetical protein Q9163_000724 [Psora crenata]